MKLKPGYAAGLVFFALFILYVNEIGYEDLPDNSLKGQSLYIAHRTHVWNMLGM